MDRFVFEESRMSPRKQDRVRERWDEDEDEDVSPVSSDFSNLCVAPSTPSKADQVPALADGARQVNGNHRGSRDFEGVDHEGLNGVKGLLQKNGSSQDYDGQEIEDASSKNYESLLEKFKALETANTILEKKNQDVTRQYQDVCMSFLKTREENTKLKMGFDNNDQLNRNLRQELEKMEMENNKLKTELRHTYVNEEFFKTQMALTETNKYIRMLEFLESTEMFNDSLDLRLCKEAHLGAREIIYQTLKRFSTNFAKDPKFDFELPQGLSEQAYNKLTNSVTDVKKRIQVGSGWPSASAQLGPYLTQARTFSGLPQLQASSFGLESYSASPSPFESLRSGSFDPTSVHNRASPAPSVAVARPPPPISVPPPRFGCFNYPPPPINQDDNKSVSINNEYLSGNTFFANVRANHASLDFPPAPAGAMASSLLDPPSKVSQDKIIDQAKRKWPHMTEANILEGLNKLRQRKVNIQNVNLVLEILSDLFETESSEDGQNSDLIECVVCLDNIEFVDKKTEACGHVFHSECIKQWLLTKQDCPICRKLLLSQEDFPTLTPSQRPR